MKVAPTRAALTRIAACGAAAILVGVAVVDVRQSAASGTGENEKLLLIAPAAPGGGWDMLAREMQNGLREEGLRRNVEVSNAEGAGGTIGLTQTANREGQSGVLTMTGLGMVGAVETLGSQHTMADATPIAQLASEYLTVVVPKNSPFRTADELADAWREKKRGLPVAGGSMGGVDQIFAAQVAQSMKVPPGGINYLPYAGGGEVLTSLLSGTAQVGFGTYGDFSDQLESGAVRALGISSPQRLKGVDELPTLREQGYDVEMSNWRGVIAPPGIGEEEAKKLERVLAKLRKTPTWADTLKRNRWTDTYQGREEFTAFLKEEVAVARKTVKALGL
ncbi:tripartite tricarboxylate transporter substrate binding protein [Streptomyces sp. XM4193]|uniref:Bug family tripartite tricarboxylate transporter substrate binding protein n=1 Tax=Streptomyces sp. XM4193 TaxID=2929782 RepID=UPI001FF9CA96|nr:tripartite tricarboxylate transporter substrate-binding protein [Streptomyces sp. XM4193]MCK1795380.1 tripartite tricarboxylate transporter substrate binding protein [Streptomyces sp. XM4193]